MQAEQIFSVNYIIYIFRQFWAWLLPLFFCYFQKLQLLKVKIFWNNFFSIVLLFVWAQKLYLRFSKSYFILKILIFLSFLVSFLVDMFKWKATFPTKKHQRWNLRHNLLEKLSRIYVAEYQRKIPSLAGARALPSCSQCNTTLITLMGMCLSQWKMCDIFSFFERCAHVLLRRKKADQTFSFKKIFLLYHDTRFFISNARLWLARNYAKAKQHPGIELLASMSEKIGLTVSMRLNIFNCNENEKDAKCSVSR